MSTRELAEAVNSYLWHTHKIRTHLDETDINKLERGIVRWPGGERREAFRAILGATTDAELGFYVNRRLPDPTITPPSLPADDPSSNTSRNRPGGGPRRDRPTGGGAPARARLLGAPTPCSDLGGRAVDTHRVLPGLGFEAQDSVAISELGVWLEANLTDTVDDVRRRSALALPALAAAATATTVVEPWNRLAYALEHPGRLDEQTVEHLQWRTREFFDREEYTPGRCLVPDLRVHTERMVKLAKDGPARFHRALMTSIGEALALAAWLAWDSGMSETAERTYDKAVEVAQDAEDGPLIACTLGYRSYLAEAVGDLPAARELLVGAQGYAHGQHCASTRSWLAAREAEVAAALSSEAIAQRALDRALTVYDYAHPRGERSWTAFFTPSRLGSMAVTTYARTNHPNLESTTEAVLASLPSNEVKAKAIILADAATAVIQLGDNERGASLGNRALDHTLAREVKFAQAHLRYLHTAISQRPPAPELAELDERLVTHVA